MKRNWRSPQVIGKGTPMAQQSSETSTPEMAPAIVLARMYRRIW